MKIATRNLLAELLLEALDDRITATALRCLARACRTNRHAPFSMAVDQLLEPAQAPDREAVSAKLHATALLSWDFHDGSRKVTLASAFVAEWQEIRDKFTRFHTAFQEWSPDTQDAPMQQALKKGALLFNHQLFFEVHEILEAQWRLANGEEKIFLQGLIQIAVALYHLQNRNVRGALLLFQDGIEKLAPHQPAFLGVDLSPFITEVKRLRNHLQHFAPEDIAQVRTLTIPRLNFTTNHS